MNKIFFQILFVAGSVIAVSCNKAPESAQHPSDTLARAMSVQKSGENRSHRGNIAVDTVGKTYRVLAKVTAVDKANGTITIDHEGMEGFMDAMEMPYKVGDPSLFEKVRVGTEGHFTLHVVNDEGTIIAIHVHHK